MASIDMSALEPAEGPPVVLASASTTRAALLTAAGVRMEPRPASIDEAAVRDALQAEGATAQDAATTLAELKAERVTAGVSPESIVLGADQILTCAGRWFEKPPNRAAARAQLLDLTGREHELATAVVAFRGGARIWHHAASAHLWLRPCSPEFIDAYLDALGEAAYSSVGAYQIEGLGAQLLARIEGDHFVIQGLPLLEVLEFLRMQGVLLP